jgi:hypothetical protein
MGAASEQTEVFRWFPEPHSYEGGGNISFVAGLAFPAGREEIRGKFKGMARMRRARLRCGSGKAARLGRRPLQFKNKFKSRFKGGFRGGFMKRIM